MKRLFIPCCGLLALANTMQAEPPALGKSPHIVLIMTDDMGWMDSTPYGSQYYETPQMERLTRQSMRFTDA